MRTTQISVVLAVSLRLASPGHGGPVGITDMDSDGVFSPLDICSNEFLAPNPLGCDTDADGHACDGDLNNDGVVDGSDFNSPTQPDFLEFFATGQVGPSGFPCAGTVPCP